MFRFWGIFSCFFFFFLKSACLYIKYIHPVQLFMMACIGKQSRVIKHYIRRKIWHQNNCWLNLKCCFLGNIPKLLNQNLSVVSSQGIWILNKFSKTCLLKLNLRNIGRDNMSIEYLCLFLWNMTRIQVPNHSLSSPFLGLCLYQDKQQSHNGSSDFPSIEFPDCNANSLYVEHPARLVPTTLWDLQHACYAGSKVHCLWPRSLMSCLSIHKVLIK